MWRANSSRTRPPRGHVPPPRISRTVAITSRRLHYAPFPSVLRPVQRSIKPLPTDMSSAFITATPLLTPKSSRRASLCTRRNAPYTTVRPALRMALDPNLPTHLLAANPVWLTKVADAIATLNLPKWLVEWGHPGMMAFMVLGMGTPGAYIGWQGRLNPDKRAGVAQKRLHENIMIAFFLLAFLGGTGGTLSVAMQGYDIWQSPHFISSAVVLAMLAVNSTLAYSGFTIGNDGTPKGRLQGRKLHAYFGIATMLAFLVHGALGALILLG